MTAVEEQVCQQCRMRPVLYTVGSKDVCANCAPMVSATTGYVVKVFEAPEPPKESEAPVNTLKQGYYCSECEEVHEGEPSKETWWLTDGLPEEWWSDEHSKHLCPPIEYTETEVLICHRSEEGPPLENYTSGIIWECGDCGAQFVDDDSGETAEEQARSCCN